MIYKLNGVVIDINAQHTINGRTYPRGSLLGRRAEWVELGVTEESDPAPTQQQIADLVKANAAAEIERLERTYLMPRATREFMLAVTEATQTPEQLAANVGYAKVKAFDDTVRALRAQLL